MEVTRSRLSGNMTHGDEAPGGAISAEGGSINLTNSTATENATWGRESEGGAIHSESGFVTLLQSSVRTNTTDGDFSHGGGIFGGGNISIFSSTVSGNAAIENPSRGGGIYGRDGLLHIDQSTISGNSASRLGGGFVQLGDLQVSRSTIVRNTSGEGGGGLMRHGSFTSRIEGSIIAENMAPTAPDAMGVTGSRVSDSIVGNNLGFQSLESTAPGERDTQGNQVGSPMTPLSPLLGPLAENGGPTQTHATQPGSPAIDAGDEDFQLLPLFDQRGSAYPRVAGRWIDVGAFENQSLPYVCDLNNDLQCDGDDIDLLQENIVTGTTDLWFDLNRDGEVNAADQAEWLAQAAKHNRLPGGVYLLGDADLNGRVDGQDFVIWNTNKFRVRTAWTQGNFNTDSRVDGQDFILWNNNKFTASVGRDTLKMEDSDKPMTPVVDQFFAKLFAESPRESKGASFRG
ncbi:MAG: choice-of-anchor Q domain-containing protein [Planctomycetota bacterium]